MMTYFCDKCGKPITDHAFVLRAFNNPLNVNNPKSGATYHLCLPCACAVQKFIEGKNAPTADVREVKRGHWVKISGFVTPGGDPVWGCSECGKGVHVYGIEANTYAADVADHQWVSCPNCGAIMDGGLRDS